MIEGPIVPTRVPVTSCLMFMEEVGSENWGTNIFHNEDPPERLVEAQVKGEGT